MQIYRTIYVSLLNQLNLGKIRIKDFQEGWNHYGESAFEFEVLVNLKKRENAIDK